MRSALYYPHTKIRNVELVKSALLLWDRLEFIVPSPGYQAQYSDPLVAEAMEMIGIAHYPDDAEKREAHEHIEDLVTRTLPPTFFFNTRKTEEPETYGMYPQKLLRKTWDLLLGSGMIEPVRQRRGRTSATEAAGLTVMSILADCCAGKTRSRVTDRGSAYATLAGIIGANTGQASGGSPDVTDHLVPICLEVIDTASIDLKKLIKFRQREEGGGGSDYTQLRYCYREGLEKYAKELASAQGHASDAEEIKRSFQSDMKTDLADLKSELGLATRGAFYSKEILATVLAAPTSVAAIEALALEIPEASTLAGALVTLGGLLAVGNKYLGARREILRKHPMAYLYELR